MSIEEKLKILVSLYESKKNYLKKLVDNAVEEKDFLTAHYYAKAYHHVNEKLRLLYQIDDPLYDQKEFKRDWLQGFKKITKNGSLGVKSYYKKQIKHLEDEIEKLNQISRAVKPSENHNVINENLLNLLDKRIKYFRLILKNDDNFFINFYYKKKNLNLIIPHVKQLINNNVLNDHTINPLKNLGFNYTANNTKLILTLTGDNEDMLNKAKETISRIVFEIFYFKIFKNKCFIQL